MYMETTATHASETHHRLDHPVGNIPRSAGIKVGTFFPFVFYFFADPRAGVPIEYS